MSKKKLKPFGKKATEPQTLIFAISSFAPSDDGMVLLWIIGDFLKTQEPEVILESIIGCTDEPFDADKDRGMWVWEGFPVVVEESHIDLSDGELRRPKESDIQAFCYGPPAESLSDEEAGAQEEA